MTEPRENEPYDEEPSEAIRWFVLMQSDEIRPEDRQRFAAWLAHDPARETAYREVQRFWNGLDAFGNLDLDAMALDPANTTEGAKTRAIKRPRRAVAWRYAAFIAAMVMLVGASALWLASPSRLFADYRTAKGAQQTITLADRSTVDLNTDTAVSVHISERVRRVVLHRGEAFFTVAEDPGRPFDVVAGAGTIRALGTAFNVSRVSGQVTVIVFKHAVQVSHANGPAVITVAQGQRLTYSAHSLPGQVEQVDLYRALAWRRQRMVFENQQLSEVIRELNRYRPGRIIIVDAAVKQLSVTGVFDTRDTDKALRTIEETLPVRTLRLTELLIFLYTTAHD